MQTAGIGESNKRLISEIATTERFVREYAMNIFIQNSLSTYGF